MLGEGAVGRQNPASNFGTEDFPFDLIALLDV